MDVVYDVISAGNMPIFIKEVNRVIKLGYKLQGGVSVSEGHYYQAVVNDFDKYEDEKQVINNND